MNKMLKKRQNKQMMNGQNHSPQIETEPGTSLAADQETEDKDETISSTSTQDFNKRKGGERIHQSGLPLSTDQREF